VAPQSAYGGGTIPAFGCFERLRRVDGSPIVRSTPSGEQRKIFCACVARPRSVADAARLDFLSCPESLVERPHDEGFDQLCPVLTVNFFDLSRDAQPTEFADFVEKLGEPGSDRFQRGSAPQDLVNDFKTLVRVTSSLIG